MKKIQIRDWYNDKVLYETEVEDDDQFPIRTAVNRARLDGASLDRASLVGARLDGASLDRASLIGAHLDRASLDGARLDGASLDRASLFARWKCTQHGCPDRAPAEHPTQPCCYTCGRPMDRVP